MATRRPRAAPANDNSTEAQLLSPGVHFQLPPNGAALPAVIDGETEDDYIETSADRVARLLGEVAGDERAIVKVYRVPPDGGKPAWCEDYPPDQFEAGGFAMIRRKWGPGCYRIALYGRVPGKGGGDGFGFRAREDVELVAALDEPAHPQAQASDVRAILTAMQDSNRQMLEAINASRAPAVDPMAQMQTMLAMMATMKDAFGLKGGEAVSIASVLKDLRAMKDAAQEFGPDGDKDEGDPLMRTLQPLVQMIAAGSQSAPAGVPGVVLPASVGAPAPRVNVKMADGTGASLPSEPSTPVGPVAEDQDEDLQMLGAFMFIINGKAKRNADPEEAAELIYEQMPDEMFDVLRSEQWFEALVQFSPGSAPYRPWFEQVRGHVFRMLQEDAQDPQTPQPGG
jgi:hypothetical protein